MSETLLLAVPTKGEQAMKEPVSNVFAKAPTFTFVEVVKGEIRGVTVEENKAADLLQGTGPIVIKNLKDKGVDIVIANELGPGAKTLIEISGLQMVQIEAGMTVREAVTEALRQILQLPIQS
jgi:predicted Fe-Mo cluster-binding NifX family protein